MTPIYHREFLPVTDNNTDSDYTIIYNPKICLDQQVTAQTLIRKTRINYVTKELYQWHGGKQVYAHTQNTYEYGTIKIISTQR